MLKPARAPILIDERPPAIHRTGSSAGVVPVPARFSKYPCPPVFWFFGFLRFEQRRRRASFMQRNRPGTDPARFVLYGSSVHQSDAARAAGVVHRTDGAGADSFTQREPPAEQSRRFLFPDFPAPMSESSAGADGTGTGTDPAAVHQYRRRDSLEQTRRKPAGASSGGNHSDAAPPRQGTVKTKKAFECRETRKEE